MVLQTQMERDAADEGEDGKVLNFSGEDEGTSDNESDGDGDDGSDDEDGSQAADDEEGDEPIFGGLDLDDDDEEEDDEDDESPFATAESDDGKEGQDAEGEEGDADVTQETLRLRLSQQRKKWQKRVDKLTTKVTALEAAPKAAELTPLQKTADAIYGEFEKPVEELRFVDHFFETFLKSAKTDALLAQAKERMNTILKGAPMTTEPEKTETTPKGDEAAAKDPEVGALTNNARNATVREYLDKYPIKAKCVQPLRKEMTAYLKKGGKGIDEIEAEDLDAAAKHAMNELDWDNDFIMEKKKPKPKRTAAAPSGRGRAAAGSGADAEKGKDKGKEEPVKSVADWQKRNRQVIDEHFQERR